MTGVFISYSHDDLAAALTLEEGLERAGYHVFRDHDRENGIPAGARWAQELFAQLERAQAVVFLASANSLVSPWCHTELAVAVARGRPVVQIAVPRRPEEEADRPPMPIHPVLRENQALPEAGTMEAAVSLLVADLTRLGLGPGNPFSWDPDRSPYPGLVRLTAEHASVLFGRETEIATVMDRLAGLRSPGLLVVGPSGSGKSSMVRAGVLPRLARRPGAPQVLPPIDPGRHPLLQVGAALVNAGAGVDLARLVEDERAFAQALAVLAAKGGPLAICIDQAEELLSPEVAEETTALVRRLAGAGLEVVRVIVVLRSASLDAWMRDDALASFTGTDPVWVRPLDRSSLRQVILGPARLAGISVEPPELVDQLLDDTGGGQALPLLAALLEELTEGHSRLRPAVITADRYATIGPVARVIERRAAEVTRELEADRRLAPDAVVKAYLRLADVQPDGSVTRGEIDVSTLAPNEVPVYEAFEKYRLVTRDRRAASGDDATEVITAVHEAVFRSWPELARELAGQRLDLQTRTWLRRDAQEWAASGGGTVALTGGRLAQAEDWLRRQAPESSAAEPQVVQYVAAATRQRRRRLLLTWATPVLAVGLALLGVIAVLLVRQVGISEDARSATEALRLAGESRAVSSTRPDLSLLLALESAARSDDPQVEAAPFVALTRGPAPSRIQQIAGETAAGALSADSSRALLSTPQGIVEWQDGMPKPAATTGSATAVAVSADGDIVALAPSSSGGTKTTGAQVVVRGWRSSAPARTCQVGGGAVERLRLDEHGQLVLAVTADRGKAPATSRITVFSSQTCDPVLERQVSGLVKDVVLDREQDIVALAVAGTDGAGVVAWQLSGAQHAGGPLPGAPPASTSVAVHHGQLGALDASGNLWVWSLADRERGPATAPVLTTTGVRLAGLDGSDAADDAASKAHWLAVGIDAGMRVVELSLDPGSVATTTALGDPLLDLPPLGTRNTGVPLDVRAEPGGAAVLDDTGRLVHWRLDAPTPFGDAAPATPFRAVAAYAQGVLAVGPDGVWRVPLTGAKGEQVLDLNGTSVAVRGEEAVVGTLDGTVLRMSRVASSGAGAAPEPLRHLDGSVVGVALLEDGTVAAVSTHGRLVVLDPSGRTPDRDAQLGAVATAMASAGSQLFVTTADGRLLVVDLSSSGSLAVQAYPAHSGTAKSVAVSDDGRMLATGGDDRQIALWAVKPGMPQLARLSGHTDMVTALAFSADGTRLASASQDQTVRLWDLDRREELGEQVRLTASPGLVFVPATQRLAVAGSGLMLWPMDATTWRRTACDILGERRLTQPEIDQYLRGSAPAASC